MNLKKILKSNFSIKKEDGYKVVMTIFNRNLKFYSNKSKMKYLQKINNKNLLYINQLKFIIDSCCDIRKCKPASGTLRTIQILKLKGLKIIVKIFEKNNIEYWVDGGTCLGAYRHGGFIPWDDDIDIVVPRYDYLRAIKTINNELNNTEIRAIIGQRILKKCHTQVARILDTSTDFAYLDIFPYDFCNNNLLSKDELMFKLKTLQKQIYSRHFLKKLYDGKHKIEDYIPQIIEEYKKAEIIIPDSKNCYVFRGVDSMSHQSKQTIHNFSDIFPLKKLKFEDITVNAPNNTEQFLKNINEGSYGDIMSFPPLGAMSLHMYNDSDFLNKIEYQDQLINKILNYFENKK